MTSSEMINIVANTHQVRRLGRVFVNGAWQDDMTAAQKRDVVKDMLPMVVNDLVMRGAWDFALKETLVGGGTVIDQKDYTLDDDADNTGVYQIYIEGRELTKKSLGSVNRLTTNYSVTGILYWSPNGRSGQAPIIRLTATPGSAGEEIKYLHWVRKKFDDLPEQFHKAVRTGLVASLDPRFEVQYDREVKVLLDDYGLSSIDVEVAETDRVLAARNRSRDRRYGYGRSSYFRSGGSN